MIISKVDSGAIDDDNNSCHGYYIITFSLSPYTLQEDFNIDGKVISSIEMVCCRP